MSATPAIKYGFPSDMEGFVRVKTKLWARKSHQYLRISGGILSIHPFAQAQPSWEASVVGAKCRRTSRRSFRITLSCGTTAYVSLYKATRAHNSKHWRSALRTASTRTIDRCYDKGPEVGYGMHASVRRATHLRTGERVAIKTVDKSQFDSRTLMQLNREMFVCANVRAPGMVRTREVYNMLDKVHIVMDLMEGGSLKDRINEVGGSVSERIAAPIIARTLRSLAHLHRRGVVHRDVKAENILCDTAPLDRVHTVICDFGYTNFVCWPTAQTMQTLCGTPVHVAPEMLKRRGYGSAVDIFAAGVMAYCMISGKYPYDGWEDNTKTLRLIAEGKLGFEGAVWDTISEECKSFMRGVLQNDPRKRLSAEGALQHRWLVQACASPSCSDRWDVAGELVSAVTDMDDAGKRQADKCPEPAMSAVTDLVSWTGLPPRYRSAEVGSPIASERNGVTSGEMGLEACEVIRARVRRVVCVIVFIFRLQERVGSQSLVDRCIGMQAHGAKTLQSRECACAGPRAQPSGVGPAEVVSDSSEDCDGVPSMRHETSR